NLFDLLAPQLPLLPQWVKAKAQGVVCDGVHFQVDWEGRQRHISLTMNWVAPDKLMATLGDVTEWMLGQQRDKAATQKLLDERAAQVLSANQEMESVLNALPMMVACWNHDLTLRFANRTYADWFQRERKSMAKLPLAEILGMSQLRTSTPYIQAVLSGSPQSFERKSDGPTPGAVRYGLIQYLPDIQHGNVQCFYELISDISSEKQSRLALAASETLLRRAGRLANVGAWAIDLRRRTLFWSEYMYTLHGVGVDFVPTLDNGLLFYSAEDRVLMNQAITDAIENRSTWDLEMPLNTADGRQ
ncbi:MAG: hypothetical protein CFE44_25895, partial [Burkholderiales bacterium PBB4]